MDYVIVEAVEDVDGISIRACRLRTLQHWTMDEVGGALVAISVLSASVSPRRDGLHPWDFSGEFLNCSLV